MSSGKGSGPQNPDSTYKGVTQNSSGKWVAEIRHTNRPTRLVLGPYPTALEAALAYDSAARKLYGPRAHVNLPDLVIIDDDGPEVVPTSNDTSGDRVMTAPVPIPEAQTVEDVDEEEAPEVYSQSAGSEESVNSYAVATGGGGSEAYHQFEVSDFDEGVFEKNKVAAPVAKYPVLNEALWKEVMKEEERKFEPKKP